jgi:hypothetical protein
MNKRILPGMITALAFLTAAFTSDNRASAASFVWDANDNTIHNHDPRGATTIKGRVDPVDAAVEVLAISGSDSLKVTITDGAFTINVKPGIYKIIVVAKVPYKNVIKDDVQVAEGNTTDLGTIKLQQ